MNRNEISGSQVMAPVNKIIPFSSVDGPGNRTVIFLQGCNFDCKYCHNPETRALCINCGLCVEKCPTGALTLETIFSEDTAHSKTSQTGYCFTSNDDFIKPSVVFHPEKCVSCDTCIKTCQNNASPRIINMTAQDAFDIVKKQIPYIRGITVSGGECTFYPDFIRELFILCKEAGLSTFIDSNGSYDFSQNPSLLEVTDSVMLDIKAFDESQHVEVTGQSNEMVLKNAIYLAEIGKLFEVRTVVVPELFDCRHTIIETGKLLADYQPIRYKIIAYRPMGVREQYRIYSVPSQELLEKYATILQDLNWKDVVII